MSVLQGLMAEPEMADKVDRSGANWNQIPVLERLRRQQCYQLCEAYEIPYPEGARKDEMLPIISSAQHMGRIPMEFTATATPQPIHPEALMMSVTQFRLAQAAKVTPETTVSVPENHLTVKWGGPRHKWRIMRGDVVVQHGFDTEQAAMEAMNEPVERGGT